MKNTTIAGIFSTAVLSSALMLGIPKDEERNVLSFKESIILPKDPQRAERLKSKPEEELKIATNLGDRDAHAAYGKQHDVKGWDERSNRKAVFARISDNVKAEFAKACVARIWSLANDTRLQTVKISFEAGLSGELERAVCQQVADETQISGEREVALCLKAAIEGDTEGACFNALQASAWLNEGNPDWLREEIEWQRSTLVKLLLGE